MEDILFDFIGSYIRITEADKALIRSMILVRSYKKGELLLEQGKKSKDSYLVMKGCLRSYYIIDGAEKTTEFFTEQDLVAPVCVAEDAPSQYNISCAEDSVLLVSNPQMEAEGFEKFPQFETMCRILAEQQFARKQSELDSFKMSSPEQRYLHLLQSRPQLLQRVPQHQLASYLGITPQSLSRMRKRIVS